MLRLMAWQSTPISMLSRVIPENTTKTANSQNRGTLSCQHVVCATLRMCLCVCACKCKEYQCEILLDDQKGKGQLICKPQKFPKSAQDSSLVPWHPARHA